MFDKLNINLPVVPSNTDSWPCDANSYSLIETLGKKNVYKAICTTNNELCVVKILSHLNEEKRQKMSQSERELAGKLNHANIVKIFCVFNNDTSVWIILELIKVGSLNTFFENRFGTEKRNKIYPMMSEKIIAAMIKQILTGVNYLHAMDLIHRDLKPDNIVINRTGIVKLCDFGMVVNSDTNDNSKVGTVPYMSPELLKMGKHSKKGDIWACGLIALELATGTVTFKSTNLKDLMLEQEKCKNKLSLIDLGCKFSKAFSTDFDHFVNLCLKYNPTERPSAEHLLQHPFIKSSEPASYLIAPLRLTQRAAGFFKNIAFPHYGTTSGELPEEQ